MAGMEINKKNKTKKAGTEVEKSFRSSPTSHRI